MNNRAIKRVITLGILALVLANIIFPNSVQASGMVDGDMTIEEGAEPLIQSEEDKKIEAEKMTALKAFIAQEDAMQTDVWEATASLAYQVNNAHSRKSMIW